MLHGLFVSVDYEVPTVGVGEQAVLYVSEVMVEACAYGAGLSVVAEDVGFACFGVVDFVYGRDDGCCAASSGLFEG